MQQPLAHLYFLTLLEHLQAKKYMLSGLICIANEITQQLTSSARKVEEVVVLWIELQAVLQVVLQKLATHLDPFEPHMGEIQPLAENINRYPIISYNVICCSVMNVFSLFCIES